MALNFQDVLRDVHQPTKHALQVDLIEAEITTNIGNVTLSPSLNTIGFATVYNAAGSSFIGLASIQGNVNLNAGINSIGFATVYLSNPTLSTVVIGTKTNNAAVPGATNIGSLQGIANAVAPTWTETYLVAESMDLSGNQRTTLGTLIAGENQTTNRLNVEPVYSYAHITAAAPTTTTIKSGAGTLHAIDFTAVATGVITIYDNTAGSGTIIRIITSPAAILQNEVNKVLDISFTTGLTIVTATAAQDIVVAYR